MNNLVQPSTHIVLRLPSELHKLVDIQPNTLISLGKFGTFYSNHLIGRPFHCTYEILDDASEDVSDLRVVPASELHAHIDQEPGEATPQDSGAVTEYEIVDPEGDVVMRSNADDSSNAQSLTPDEIELLKKNETASGKDVVAKIMASHKGLDKKSAYSLAKYTLRKKRKFLRRFTVLPLDVTLLAHIILYERDAARLLDMREEVLALACSWANVRCGYADSSEDPNRWLAVDETGGIVVAAMAERMGILYPSQKAQENGQHQVDGQPEVNGQTDAAPSASDAADAPASLQTVKRESTSPSQHPTPRADTGGEATSNTITLLHANSQPNLALLPYFSYNPSNPDPSHPIHSHLKSLTWLQLLHPTEDSLYVEPPRAPAEELKTWKGGRRSAYYRKRRRWERTATVVDDARSGGFSGLIVASLMEPVSVLKHTVPLLRGGAQIVVYSSTIESLVVLQDYYSKIRRTAYLKMSEEERKEKLGGEDFPVDPTLLLGTAVHAVRARPWQVLPGRTHPLMMDRGGADGFLFVGTRVLPAEGVKARGQFDHKKRRKVEDQ